MVFKKILEPDNQIIRIEFYYSQTCEHRKVYLNVTVDGESSTIEEVKKLLSIHSLPPQLTKAELRQKPKFNRILRQADVDLAYSVVSYFFTSKGFEIIDEERIQL